MESKSLLPLFAILSGSKVRTIVTLVPAEQGMYRLKLRHLNFDLYLVVLAQDRELVWYLLMQQCICLNFETIDIIGRLKIKVCLDKLLQ